jgi:hypothetical protein
MSDIDIDITDTKDKLAAHARLSVVLPCRWLSPLGDSGVASATGKSDLCEAVVRALAEDGALASRKQGLSIKQLAELVGRSVRRTDPAVRQLILAGRVVCLNPTSVGGIARVYALVEAET